MTSGGDFWSRRKAAVQAEQEAEIGLADSRAEQTDLAAQDQRPDAEILAELNLPDPDMLQPGDDVVRFMARAVPNRLRQRALRKLWTLNPVLANLDGLVDYGEDFTDAAGISGKIETSYRVGKGMLACLDDLARQAETAPDSVPGDSVGDLACAPGEPTEPPDPALTQTPGDRSASAEPTTEPTAEPTTEPTTVAATEISAPAPRRMRFAFEG